MAKVAITVSIEKEDLLQLLKLAKEKHQTPQTIIRALINKQLKKVNYETERKQDSQRAANTENN